MPEQGSLGPLPPITYMHLLQYTNAELNLGLGSLPLLLTFSSVISYMEGSILEGLVLELMEKSLPSGVIRVLMNGEKVQEMGSYRT